MNKRYFDNSISNNISTYQNESNSNSNILSDYNDERINNKPAYNMFINNSKNYGNKINNLVYNEIHGCKNHTNK
jgi:hypothetical protein